MTTTQPLSALTMLLSRHTRRREFITLLDGLAAVGAAQQPRRSVIESRERPSARDTSTELGLGSKRSRMRIGPLFASFAVALCLVGCGEKGDPGPVGPPGPIGEAG